MWIIFALLDPDPDCESGSRDPIESGSGSSAVFSRFFANVLYWDLEKKTYRNDNLRWGVGRNKTNPPKNSIYIFLYPVSAILLCGPCDSGKTTLFSQLLHGKPMETYTSMKVNDGKLLTSMETSDKMLQNMKGTKYRIRITLMRIRIWSLLFIFFRCGSGSCLSLWCGSWSYLSIFPDPDPTTHFRFRFL